MSFIIGSRPPKGYVTHLTDLPAEFVIGAYQWLLQVKKSFRMPKGDLRARSVYPRVRDAINAHLQIVTAALAVSRWVEDTIGWSVRGFARIIRVCQNATATVGEHEVEAAVPWSPTPLASLKRSKPVPPQGASLSQLGCDDERAC